MKPLAALERCEKEARRGPKSLFCPNLLCTPTWQLECPEIETPLSPHADQTDRLTAPAQSMPAAAQGHTRTRTQTRGLAHLKKSGLER